MSSIRLALAFLRIPRLFASLLLFPLIVGLAFIYTQLFVTGLVMKSLTKGSAKVERTIASRQNYHVARLILFGDGKPRPPLKVCRWGLGRTRNGVEFEGPRVEACQPDRLDVAIRVADPESFDPTPYVELFQGNIDRLHLCRTCSPDVVIHPTATGTTTNLSSVWGLLILNLLTTHEEANEKLLAALRSFDELRDRVGATYLHIAGFDEPVRISHLSQVTAVILNIAGLIVVALWLALRAHRKVLDYFSQSGALLPLVAASGQSTFYGSIWILTMLRVGAFLIGAIPMTVVGFLQILDAETVGIVFKIESALTGYWIAALATSLALATLIGSIAELKHRHALFSVLYRYVPLVFCLAGGLMWGATFLLPDDAAQIVRLITTSAPLLGTVGVLVAPIFKPQAGVLIVHTLLTGLLIAWAMRRNARWFAAHLEEI